MSNKSFLRNELLELQVKADELDAENIKLGKENEKFENENKKLRSTINDLNILLCNTVDRKDFEDLTNKYENLEKKLEDSYQNLKIMKKENEFLNNTNEHCLKNYNELEDKCEILKKENIELKTNINELKSISKETLKDATFKSEEVEQQHEIISALQEENESLKTHLNYLKEQQKKNISVLSGGDSFMFDQLSNNSILMPESMDIIVETKLRDCQKQLEETETNLTSKEQELNKQKEQLLKYETDLKALRNEICTFERNKIELEDHLECELNKKNAQMVEVNQQLTKVKADYETLNASLMSKEKELESSVEKLEKLSQENNDNEQKIQNLEKKLNQLDEQLSLKKEKCVKLINELDTVKKQNSETLLKLKEQVDEELNELVRKHREELNVMNLQQEQKLSTLTDELSKQEEEQIKIRAEIDELMNRNKELQSNYDQLIEQRDELKSLLEIKDAELIDLKSENEKLNLDVNKFGEEIERINEFLSEKTTLVQTDAINELTNEKEVIEFERNELEKQVKELKSALNQSKDEYSQLVKKHQEEMFRLSEAMNKKPDDYKLRTDMQNVLKELKCKEDQLIELQTELEKRNELTQQHLILIEKLKANDRERNHSLYMLKQKLNEQESKIKNYYDLEVENNRLKADLKCTQDSYALEHKTKERYYRELTELEKRKSSCLECTKLERSNSISFNASDQTLIYKDPSNPKLIQKIPNPNKYLMEDEEGQFMTTTHINEARKRKTEFNDEEDYNKRLNILQQRNARQKPHLKTSYALELNLPFQEVGSSNFLNEKIKNSEKFVIDDDENTNAKATNQRNPSMLRQFSSLRFRKH